VSWRRLGAAHDGGMTWHHPHVYMARGAAALAAAMGIGRFAYTPILPLMTAQTALTPQASGHLATANYVGYLAGALAGMVSRRLARSPTALRASLVMSVATLMRIRATRLLTVVSPCRARPQRAQHSNGRQGVRFRCR
jgi:MFS family permease